DVAHLDELAQRIDSLIEAGNCFQAAETDLLFHRYVWQKSGNPVLYQVLDVLTVPLFAFMSVMLNMVGIDHYRTLALPHHDLVEAVRQRDPERVRKAIREHLPISSGSIARARMYPVAQTPERISRNFQ